MILMENINSIKVKFNHYRFNFPTKRFSIPFKRPSDWYPSPLFSISSASYWLAIKIRLNELEFVICCWELIQLKVFSSRICVQYELMETIRMLNHSFAHILCLSHHSLSLHYHIYIKDTHLYRLHRVHSAPDFLIFWCGNVHLLVIYWRHDLRVSYHISLNMYVWYLILLIIKSRIKSLDSDIQMLKPSLVDILHVNWLSLFLDSVCHVHLKWEKDILEILQIWYILILHQTICGCPAELKTNWKEMGRRRTSDEKHLCPVAEIHNRFRSFR